MARRRARLAFLTKPYFKVPPRQKDDYQGYPTFSAEQVTCYVDQAFANHWQLLAHMSGDAAIDQFITAVRAAEARYGKADRRPVAIHAHIARPQLRAGWQAVADWIETEAQKCAVQSKAPAGSVGSVAASRAKPEDGAVAGSDLNGWSHHVAEFAST